MIQPLWKTDGQFLKNLNTHLPYDSAVLLLGIYSRELKMYVHPKTVQAYLRDVACLVPDHCDKMNIAIKPSTYIN